MTKPRKKLIEVALPLEAINAAAAREKNPFLKGHPRAVHLWWARRPLAAARTVIFAQMVDDPSSCPELFPTEQEQDKERQRLFALIKELVQWENTTNERVLQAARDEIWQSWRRACAGNADHPRAKELFDRHKLPAFHDPFAGGGSLPLEAQRLGLEAYASDLNPVAVLINKAMIEIPPKFANMPPVNPEARASLLGAPLGAPASSRHNQSSTATPEWRSRGYVPHRDAPGLLQSVTFRLADALPASVLAAWEHELAALPEDERHTQREQRINEWLDRGHGACHLRDERIAALVEAALLHDDGERYRLLAWCIMPNHVHVLIQQCDGHPLSSVVHSWKSYTATKANALLGRKGSFWQREYHDRFIRDERHYVNTVNYIENNPVKVAWWSGRRSGGTRARRGRKEKKTNGSGGAAGIRLLRMMPARMPALPAYGAGRRALRKMCGTMAGGCAMKPKSALGICIRRSKLRPRW